MIQRRGNYGVRVDGTDKALTKCIYVVIVIYIYGELHREGRGQLTAGGFTISGRVSSVRPSAASRS